jgi:hypothetical protein
MWIKHEKEFGVPTSHEGGCTSEELSSPSHHEELQVASISGRDDSSFSSTSPTCDKLQGNDIVSGEIICGDGNVSLYNGESCSINANGVERLDLNTYCNKYFAHTCVKGPCISPRIFLIKFCDDMLVSICGHDQNAYVSSTYCMTNHVEEIKRKLAHTIEEEISGIKKKFIIKRKYVL